ncbi:MAG: sortase [Anaerolineales bacterium]
MAILPVRPAYAATITVTTTTDVIAVNGACSFREAFQNARNDNGANADCAAGTGNDTIVFNINAASPTITLASALPQVDDGDGLTIDGTNLNAAGGNVTISSGGVFRIFNITAGTTTIRDITLSNGQVDGSGGAIQKNGGTNLIIDNVIFDNNRTVTTNTNDGGAIFQVDGNLTITNSRFTSNSTRDDGGAISFTGTTLTITNSVFSSNTAGVGAAGGADGGAIFSTGTTVIKLSSFVNNSITMAADQTLHGGAVSTSGTLTVANSTFSGNSLTKSTTGGGNVQGGAIYATANATVHNVTFSGNSVSESGTGTADGGTIYRQGGTFSVANSILYNGTENGAGGNCGGTITNSGNNITYLANDCGVGLTNSDPLLDTLTVSTPQYFPLRPGSPALDAGSNAICGTATTTNNQSQNSVTRSVDANGDGTATCDIGSYEAPATFLTLIKSVTNNNGGTAVATAWTISATGPKNISGTTGAGTITNVNVPAGNFTLSESSIAGYTNTSITCNGTDINGADGLSLGIGENVTCTFTNDDVAPSLTLLKTVVNDNGGTALNTAWTLSATGTGGSPTNISGNTPVASGTTFKADTYSLAETGGPAGYTASLYSCVKNGAPAVLGNSITLALGDVAVCTITNNDVPPSLTLQKTVVNDNGGNEVASAWTLSATGTGGTPTNLSGSTLVASGSTFKADTYLLAETGGPTGYTASLYSCIKNGSPAVLNNSITLAVGDVAVCTITNDDMAPSLTLQKTVVNDNGGNEATSAWTLTATGPTSFSGVGPTVNNVTSFDAGHYVLSESGATGYTQTSLVCSGSVDNDLTDGIDIALGEDVTCTFTNNDQPAQLTLQKTVVNDNGGTASSIDFIPSVNGTSTTWNTPMTLDAGVYTVSETSLSGYAAGSWGGDCAADGSIVLTPGQIATCTITNDDIAATITLQKTVVNDNGGNATQSNFIPSIDGNPTSWGTPVAVSLTPHLVSESILPGYSAGLWGGDCATDGSITLSLGQNAVCTITNDDIAPTLTLIKVVTNNDGGTALVSDWILTADGPSMLSGVTGTGAVTNVVIEAGSYSLLETKIDGYSLTAITCSGNDENGLDGLDIYPGENVTCIFQNDDIGATLTLLKEVTNNNIGTAVDIDWTLSAQGPSVVSGKEGDTSITNANVSAGTYSLSESGPANYTQTSLTCTGTDADGSDGLNLKLGEDVTCTFYNDDDLPVVTVQNINSTPDTGDATISENETVNNNLNLAQLTVQFNWDVYNPVGASDTDDVDNPNNYILLYSATGSFNTPSCAVVANGGVVAPDIPIPVLSVVYSNGGGSGPYVATLNLSAPLTTVGYYRLFVCGTTSIVLAVDPTITLSGNGITAGTDFVRNFRITPVAGGGGGGGGVKVTNAVVLPTLLPATGFAPNKVTILPEQPEEQAFRATSVWLEIPRLSLRMPIVGVPLYKDDWNISWLWREAGWLEGTAFPTWQGNSVLTGHVTLPDGETGPFALLDKLQWGDRVFVHAYGTVYIYEVRENRTVAPNDTSILKHEDEAWLTLVTCKTYIESTNLYLNRIAVRAVLIETQVDKTISEKNAR